MLVSPAAFRCKVSRCFNHIDTGGLHILQQTMARLNGAPAQIVLSGLARSRSLPAERMFHYERERILQEEERLRQAIIFCQGDLAALQAQIEVIQMELSFLQ